MIGLVTKNEFLYNLAIQSNCELNLDTAASLDGMRTLRINGTD